MSRDAGARRDGWPRCRLARGAKAGAFMTGIDVPVVVDWPTDGVCRLRLNNPERLNALSGPRSAPFRPATESPSGRPREFFALPGAGGAFAPAPDLKDGRAPNAPDKSPPNRPYAATAG